MPNQNRGATGRIRFLESASTAYRGRRRTVPERASSGRGVSPTKSAREQSAPRVGIQSPLRIDHRAFSSVIRPWPLSFAAPKYAISDVQYLMRGRPVHSTVWCRDTLGWSLDKHRRNGISFQQPCFGHSPNILNCHSGRDLAQNQAFCSWLDYCKFGDNQVHSAHRS